MNATEAAHLAAWRASDEGKAAEAAWAAAAAAWAAAERARTAYVAAEGDAKAAAEAACDAKTTPVTP